MELNIADLVQAFLIDYPLPLFGDHGVTHWARVLENGERLAAETGADLEVVRLFAIFHDSQRVNEYHDPEHGPRAAAFAGEYLGPILGRTDHRLRLLMRACQGHTHERTHPDVTIQTCWDADRLDLGRVGITPHPGLLCTDVARRPDTIAWAESRARFRVVPDFVTEEWGLALH